MLANEMTLWLLGTAIIFTFVGRYLGFRANIEDVVGSTIDSLIADGYLKTRGVGSEMEILKHTEWCKDND